MKINNRLKITLTQLWVKDLWKKIHRQKEFERAKKTLAIRLLLSMDIEEAIELLREKLPYYDFPVERARTLIELLRKIVYNYQWENIDYWQARRFILKYGIPEPYVLLAEFLLRDNGIRP